MTAPRLVTLPAGEFQMGENADDKFANDTERPRHRVRFAHGFALGAFPVTVGEFRLFRPAHPDPGPEDVPVTLVSWLDAAAYCAWLSEQAGQAFRLPSEAEWEYAARAGGGALSPATANFLYAEDGRKIGPGRRTPAGAYPPDVLGLRDLHGNVCEWCADLWHPTYEHAPADGSAWLEDGSAGRRVLRGGAWDYLPRLLRSSWRDSFAESSRRDNLGFRLAADLP